MTDIEITTIPLEADLEDRIQAAVNQAADHDYTLVSSLGPIRRSNGSQIILLIFREDR